MPDVVMVAAGLGNLAAITSAGALLRWRRNNDGKRKRGQGDREDRWCGEEAFGPKVT